MADPTEEEIKIADAQTRSDVGAEVFEGKEPVIISKPDKGLDDDSDPLAGVNPALLETLNNITGKLSAIDSFADRLKQTESRIGALTNKEIEEKRSREKAEKEKPTKEEVEKALKSDENWDEFEKEFPDMATAIEGRFTEKLKTVDSLRQEISEIKTATSAKTDDDLEVRLVGLMHPGWQKTVKTKDFTDWLGSQPDDVKQKYNHGTTAEEAVHVLNLFKKPGTTKTAEDIAADRRIRLSLSSDKTNKHKQKKLKAEGDMSEAELRADVGKEVFGK